LSRTTSGARSSAERYGASYVDTRSLCSPTRSTSVEGTAESRRGSLRESLDCLARAIERLSYSYRTFNTSFSWTLDLSTSVYEEKSTGSKSSTAEAGEDTLQQPMIILDNLEICEQRAKAMIEAGASPALPGMLEGRERHQLRSLMKLAERAANALRRRGFTILGHKVEAPLLTLTVTTRSGNRIRLRGRPDIVIAAATLKKQLMMLNIEYTTYSTAPETITLRQALYAHTLYKTYGFPVVPALVVDTSRETKAYILAKKSEGALEARLRSALARLAELAEGAPAKPARSREACYTCPLAIRNTCPYWEG